MNVGLAVLGAVLLFLTIRGVGWADVQAGLERVGWWFAAVLVLGGLRFVTRAQAWRLCARALASSSLRAHTQPQAEPVSPGLWPFFKAVLSADALGNVTPLGLVASEPAKVLFVSERVPTVVAIASVAAENAFYMATVLAMIGAGALVFFEVADLSSALRLGAQSVLATVMLSAVAGLWIVRRQPALLSRLARLFTRATGRGQAAPERLRDIEVLFYDVVRWPPARMLTVLAWEALFHIAAVAEVYVVLRLLPAARPITLLDVFVLETAGRLIVVAFKFVPYRLGVDEAGTALVARALALDPTVGVTLALVRRLRILCWNAVGLLLLGRVR